MSLTDQVQELSTRVLDLIFPPKCVHCKKVGQSQLCQTCRADFAQIDQVEVCPHCGRPDSAGLACLDCQKQGPSAAPLRSAYLHAGPVQSALWALKYDNRRMLAGVLAEAVSEVIPLTAFENFDALCPVPLHSDREAERGFNQSQLLAVQLSRLWGTMPVLDKRGLRRLRHTESQVGLNRVERQANVAEAFRADEVYVGGKSLVLVDDVCTTGSTLNASADALMEAGAARVAAVTVSRALSTVGS